MEKYAGIYRGIDRGIVESTDKRVDGGIEAG
jgi:hypothetical protein